MNLLQITKCVDKYRIREYLKEKKLTELLLKLYGVYDNAENIDFEALPKSFVIKCNHGCGFNIIVTDKAKIDKNDIINKLNNWMSIDY